MRRKIVHYASILVFAIPGGAAGGAFYWPSRETYEAGDNGQRSAWSRSVRDEDGGGPRIKKAMTTGAVLGGLAGIGAGLACGRATYRDPDTP